MNATIDWMYHRKSCTTCKKTHEFLNSVACTVTETVDSNKVKYGPETVLDLLQGITRLIATKGKKIIEHDLANARPDDETLKSLLIGPTGNLRAPTARVGTTLIVGFHETPYRTILGLNSENPT